MPNHVTTKITINADDKTVATIFEAIQGDQSQNNNYVAHIDFNKIKPMPKELLKVTSPVTIVDARTMQEQLWEREKWERDGGIGFAPTVGLTEELRDEYLEKFGADNWYHWSTMNWGTKWNAYGTGIEGNTLIFDTAWAHPFEIVSMLSKKYPDVEFHAQYADEDLGHNQGDYVIMDGEIIQENSFEDGTDEALDFACLLKYNMTYAEAEKEWGIDE